MGSFGQSITRWINQSVYFFLAFSALVYALPNKNKKSIGIFDFVKFPNDVCFGDGSVRGGVTQLSGNCFTKQECDELKGTAAGDCADGYGVCCVLRPGCDETVKQNLSYLIMAETQAPDPKYCSYTICPASSSVNRIRLQFTTFVIGGPFTLTNTAANNAANAINGGAIGSDTRENAVGDCVDDTFVVTSTGKASPVICGTNTDQHVVVDADGETCLTASFVFGGRSITREYEIRVLQYEKENGLGGPEGCLQYFIDNQDTVKTFNWDSGPGTVKTHLSNQDYDICIRRNRGMCGICWTQEGTGEDGTFSLSTSPTNNQARSRVGATCTTDFILIPNGIEKPTPFVQNSINLGNSKYCGRALHHMNDQVATSPATVCSFQTPFKLTVVTDDDEQFGTETAEDHLGVPTTVTEDARDNEARIKPTGTRGFEWS